MHTSFKNGFFFFVLFAVIATIVSLWTGLLFLNTPLIIIFSLLISFFLYKKKPKLKKIPVETWFIALLALFIAAIPLLFIHPFYQASSDPLHSTTLRVLLIQQRIPGTYAPFTELPFTYPFAFHLLSKIFSETLFFLEETQSNWLLGAIFVFLQFIFLFLFSKEFFGSKKAGLLSIALFFGTKTVFQDFYCGLMPRVAASAFIFAFLYLFYKKNKLAVLMLAAVAVLHHGMLFNLFVFFGLHWLFFDRKISSIKLLPLAFVIGLPAVLFYYSGIFGAAGSVAFNSLSSVFEEITALPLWVGWIPAVLFSGLFFHMLWKKNFNKRKTFAFIITLIPSILFFLFTLLGINGANVLVWLISLGVVLFCVQGLIDLNLDKKNYFKHSLALLVVLSLLAFFSSGFMMKKFTGSKISIQGAEFAFKFREFDSSLKETAFFVNGPTKMAELSRKIPFNAAKGWFYPLSSSVMPETPISKKLRENQKKFEEILKSNCMKCVYDLNVDYVVIDSKIFPKMPQQPVLQHKNFFLYKIPPE